MLNDIIIKGCDSMNEQEEILVPKIDIIGKVFQFIVYILFLTLIVTISTYLSITLDIKDYNKVYGEKIDNKYYYYTNDNEKIEIKKFKDFYNKRINKINDNKVPLLYCNKNECLYINLEDRLERNNLYPKFLILIIVFIIAILELLIYMRKDTPLKKYKILYILLLMITLIGLIKEVSSISSYYFTVNKNKNFVKGVLLGERLDKEYVYKYKVNNKIYYLETNNKSDTIYYNKKDYSKAYNKMNPFNIKILIMYFLNILYLVFARLLTKKKNSE